MKRIFILASIVAVSATAMAASDVDLKTTGDFRARYTNISNVTESSAGGQEAMTQGRFRVNLMATKGEKYSFFLSALNANQYGGHSQGNDNSAPYNTNATYATNNTNNLLLVNRAWGWWKASDNVSLKFGRMGIAIADGLVFSENDWQQVPTAFEGMQAAWDPGFAKVNFYAIKQAELLNGAGTYDPEKNFYLVSFDFKNLPEAMKMANLHIMQVNRDAFNTGAAGFGTQSFEHVGLTVAGNFASFLYKLTGAYQTGSEDHPTTAAAETKISANMIDAMVGWQFNDAWKLTVGYHTDSGDDASDAANPKAGYQPIANEMHGSAGLMDVMSFGNLTFYDAKLAYKMNEDMDFGLNYYMFSRTTTNGAATFQTAYEPTAGTGLADVGVTGDKNVGSEVDLFANKNYDGGLKIGARLGSFMPTDYLKNGGTLHHDQTVYDGELEASIAF